MVFHLKRIGQTWHIPIPDYIKLDETPSIIKRHSFNIDRSICHNQNALRIHLKKNTLKGLTVKLSYDPTPIDMHVGVVFAGMILLLFYVLLIYEVSTLAHSQCSIN